MYYGHTISLFVKEKTPNAYGTHTTHLVNLCWFNSKENALKYLDRLNSVVANKNLGLFVFDNNCSLEKPLYEDGLELTDKPHSFGVCAGGYNFTITDTEQED